MTPEQKALADAVAALLKLQPAPGYEDHWARILVLPDGVRLCISAGRGRGQLHISASQGLLHVRRRKNGNPSTHPLHGPELRALRRLQRDYPNSPYIFTGERKGPLTDSTVRKMVARAGAAAGLEFPVHPHMLRHAAGYKLANDGQDTRAIQHYLGHKNISHTVRYTELSPERFKDFWQD